MAGEVTNDRLYTPLTASQANFHSNMPQQYYTLSSQCNNNCEDIQDITAQRYEYTAGSLKCIALSDIFGTPKQASSWLYAIIMGKLEVTSKHHYPASLLHACIDLNFPHVGDDFGEYQLEFSHFLFSYLVREKYT